MTVLTEYAVQARNIDPTSDNKIHDDDVARQFGFVGALVPGVELFAYLTHPLVEAWGVDFLQRGAIDVRFRQPVYDGEIVVARAMPTTDAGTVDLELVGADESVRSTGRAVQVAERPVELDRFFETPLPATLRDATPDALAPGPLGSIEERIDQSGSESYLAAITETLPAYGEKGLVHPGALLRMVNALLVRNVVLGPWIHTASSCTFLGVGRVPTLLEAHAVVTETFERNGHEYVRYDALVLSDEQPVFHVEHTAIYAVQGPSR